MNTQIISTNTQNTTPAKEGFEPPQPTNELAPVLTGAEGTSDLASGSASASRGTAMELDGVSTLAMLTPGDLWTPERIKKDSVGFMAYLATLEPEAGLGILGSIPNPLPDGLKFSGALRKKITRFRRDFLEALALRNGGGSTAPPTARDGKVAGADAPATIPKALNTAPQARTTELASGTENVSAGCSGGTRGEKRRKTSQDTPPHGLPAERKQETISAARIADPLTVALVDEGYPEARLTYHQMMMISDAVQSVVDKITDGPLPEFTNSFVSKGAVVVVAANAFSRSWLDTAIKSLAPWEGAKLRLASLTDLKPLRRATLWVPGTHESLDILRSVQRRCPELNTGAWRVYSCGSNDKESPGLGTTLALGLPETSIRALRAREFQIPWGIGRVHVRVGGKPPPNDKPEKDTSA